MTTPTKKDGKKPEESVTSSPLFLNPGSSSPSKSPRKRDEVFRTPVVGRLRRVEIESSPLKYASSSPKTTIYNSQADSGYSADLLNARERVSPRSRRGDIQSNDLMTTPIRRRLIATTGTDSLELDPTFSINTQESESNNEPTRVIWGTNVGIQESMSTFKDFLLNFKSKYRSVFDGELVDAGEGEDLLYVNMLNNLLSLKLCNLNLDARNLEAYPPSRKLYYQLISYPQEIIPIMDQTIKDCLIDLMEESRATEAEIAEIEAMVFKVRPFGLHRSSNMRDLNPSDIDSLIRIKGIVIRATPIIPDMKQAFFRCRTCNHSVTVDIDRGRIAEPTKCPRPDCGAKNSFELMHNRSEFSDKQVIKLQETPDNVPDGQTPHSVSLCAYDELVDVCKAGDRIEVTGIFRSVPVRVNPRQRTIKSLFKTYVDVVHIQKVDKKRLGIDTSTLEAEVAEKISREAEDIRQITEEEKRKIMEISGHPNLYDLLAKSIAPSIYEMSDVKKGILLQLFGGTNKTFEKGGAPRYRGDINILLCGDPSTSKSQILQYIHKIAPRGVYASGKGSSAVGLTAYISRDQDTRQLVLESGALVLSDGGICCIDEFDKMNDSTRSVLHEVMEQQTVSVAKAGIITTLNARTSILASANPIGSKYNPNIPVTKNIDLPPTLLSRFDLVYLILDKVDEKNDRKLAKHIVGMYLEDAPEHAVDSSVEIIPIELLSAYIFYAKQNFHPRITDEAREELIKCYVDLRALGEDIRAAERRITATTRQLESMIRLSEAHAKMRLSNEVTRVDVNEANRLIKEAIKDYATDPLTGRIDMDLINTGISRSELAKEQAAVEDELAT